MTDAKEGIEKEIEEVYRLGRGMRLLKVKLKLQVQVNELMNNTWALTGSEKF